MGIYVVLFWTNAGTISVCPFQVITLWPAPEGAELLVIEGSDGVPAMRMERIPVAFDPLASVTWTVNFHQLSGKRTVLIVDNFEYMDMVEEWFLSSFLPRLSDKEVLLVLRMARKASRRKSLT